MHKFEGDISAKVEDDDIHPSAEPVFEGHQDGPCEPAAEAADGGMAAYRHRCDGGEG